MAGSSNLSGRANDSSALQSKHAMPAVPLVQKWYTLAFIKAIWLYDSVCFYHNLHVLLSPPVE
ncbi:MAG: hypothetical protein LDL27_07970, partial [Desulfovibrio sp.]|nr:hypothetical protein [Desulfovibrio sp.]